MNKIKFILTLALGYTIGEHITDYRMQTTPISFVDFTKKSLRYQKQVWNDGTRAGAQLLTNPEQSKVDIRKLMFPNITA